MRIQGGIPVGGNIAGVDSSLLAQRIYGPVERGMYNRPLGTGIAQPEVYMAPYPGQKQRREVQEFFPLGNPRAGYRFEANLPGDIGNLGGLLAQAQPPGRANNANALGGGIGLNNQVPPGMSQQFGPPIQFGVDVENEKVKNLRGNVNAILDENQAIRFGGNYNVQDQSGQLGVGYQTPTFGFDVNVMRTPKSGFSPGYGVQGNVMGRF
jgi:hypothetical protein